VPTVLWDDAMEKGNVATADIVGAYLHSTMPGKILVKIIPVIATMLVEIDEKYKKYLLPDGSLVCYLNKAL
jgi:hypothetical protein